MEHIEIIVRPLIHTVLSHNNYNSLLQVLGCNTKNLTTDTLSRWVVDSKYESRPMTALRESIKSKIEPM